MSIIYDRWKEPRGHVIYLPTEKEPDPLLGNKGDAYWMLAKQIDDKLPGGGTIAEIYHSITGPLGLTSSDTVELVHSAKKMGYLK